MLASSPGPTAEQLRRGARQATQQLADSEGGIGLPWEMPGLLVRLFEGGAISAAMVQAGIEFHQQFRRAHFDPLRSADMARIPISGGCGPRYEGSQIEDSRRRVAAALDRLGGMSSPAGSCCWHCLGLDSTLRSWCVRIGWSGRRIDQSVGKGILLASLAVLTSHYGLARPPRR